MQIPTNADTTHITDAHQDFLAGQFLLRITPQSPGIDLGTWATGRKFALKERLTRHGAILFRGFRVSDVNAFSAFVRESYGEPLKYHERSSPRSLIQRGIYSSTDYPSDQRIYFHNENSYQHKWPREILFHCVEAPAKGGQTPLSDIRAVTRRISPRTIQTFREKGILYQRNYGGFVGMSWEVAFQTKSRVEVQRYCESAGIQTEWVGADHLRTKQLRRALHFHPESNEELWFNHAVFFHISTFSQIIRETLLSNFAESDLPNNTYYGDGTPIEESVLDEIRSAYEASSGMFSWEVGDVLVLDNMLIAHAREPYVGRRKIVVAMTGPVVGSLAAHG